MNSPIKDITATYNNMYLPIAALLFYQSDKDENNIYVEHFEIDSDGNPINAHPLTVNEAEMLAKSMHSSEEKKHLKPKNILPSNILHIDQNVNDTVIWYTPAQKRKLYFVEQLNLPSGNANIPPMLWKADKANLSVFALDSDARPGVTSPLYYAPYFNIYENGEVCMGTVDVGIKHSASLEEFTAAWESFFFNSYFSHLIGSINPVNGNCRTIWKDQIASGATFPIEKLKKNNRTLKNIL